MQSSLETKKSRGESRWASVVSVSLGELQGVRCDGFFGRFVSTDAVWGDGCSLARGLMLICVVWIGFQQISLHFW